MNHQTGYQANKKRKFDSGGRGRFGRNNNNHRHQADSKDGRILFKESMLEDPWASANVSSGRHIYGPGSDMNAAMPVAPQFAPPPAPPPRPELTLEHDIVGPSDQSHAIQELDIDDII